MQLTRILNEKKIDISKNLLLISRVNFVLRDVTALFVLKVWLIIFLAVMLIFTSLFLGVFLSWFFLSSLVSASLFQKMGASIFYNKIASRFCKVVFVIYKTFLSFLGYFKKESLDLIPETKEFILKIISKNILKKNGNLLKKELTSLTNLKFKKVRGELISILN